MIVVFGDYKKAPDAKKPKARLVIKNISATARGKALWFTER